MFKTIKTTASIVLSVLIVLTAFGTMITTSNVNASAESSYIDNSSLVTPWVPDSQLELDEHGWPTYTNDLVMAEFRVEMASSDGTMRRKAIEPALKHLARTGINALWITPIEDQGEDTIASTYCNMGVHTIDPYFTGLLDRGQPYSDFEPTEENYDKARKVVKEFVDLCHEYNIRVYFDKVPWGVAKTAPIVIERPELFNTDKTSDWGGYDFVDYDDPAVREYYYKENFDFIMETGCDGIRWDLEPHYFGYELYEEMHAELNEAGRKPLFFSEDRCFHGEAYAFEQHSGINGEHVSSQLSDDVYFNQIDMIESIQTGENMGHSMLQATGESGQYRYYCYQISSHDTIGYQNKSLASWGYQFLFGSFIPLFYMGEEYGMTGTTTLFGVEINDFEKQLEDPVKREYYESVKELIALRWKYKHILNASTENHRDTNICTVKVKGSTFVNGYARYLGDEGFVVVPNVNEGKKEAVKMTIALPLEDMGIDNYTTYTVTNLLTDKVMVKGDAKAVSLFTDTIEHNTCGLYYVKAEGKVDVPEQSDEPVDSEQTEDPSDEPLDSDDELDEEEEESKPKKKKKKVVKVKNPDASFPVWAIVAIAAGAAAIIAVVVILIVRKKRK